MRDGPSTERIRILALPYAGGDKRSYGPLLPDLGTELDMVCPDLPGRGARFSEPLATSLEAMVDDLLPDCENLAKQGPYAIFGHSLGAWLGYRLAVRLQATGSRAPELLFVSGAGHPSCPVPIRHTLAHDAFVAELRRLGGCPEEFLNEPALLDLFLPVLYADFQAVETYTHTDAPSLKIPIVALRGRQDEATESAVSLWARETDASFSLHEFSGGHFFLFDHVQAVTQLLRGALVR